MSATPETDAAADWYLAAAYSTDPEDRTVPLAVSRKLERERDEARDELADWQDSAKNVRKEYDDEQHCSCVPILRKLLKDAERERDEARKKTERQRERIACLEGATHHACGTPLSKAIKERDEARREIEGWRNKWECAVEMAARAEVERDEARAERDSLQALSQSLAETYAKLKTERDEWAKLCGQYKQERDEARAKP
jgi:chromosome segregation ATPase